MEFTFTSNNLEYELEFCYDSDDNIVSMVYNGVEYYYIKNIQGDIVGIMDASGTQIVTYTYDAWGKLLNASGNITIGNINPFRYRGYYYDTETGLYYINSRYYDPEISRFINADAIDILINRENLYNKNLYAYCDNNPVIREDTDGQAWNIVIGLAVGAVGGLIGQIVSDAVTSVLNEKLTISNWQTYTGAVVGGAIGGAVLGATGNIALSNALTGAITTGTGLALEKATIKNYDKSWSEIAINTVVDGTVSYGLGKLPGKKGITSGRNNYSAIFRSGLTKLRNGTAGKMSAAVMRKGLMANIFGGFYLDAYYGLKQFTYPLLRSW